MPPTALPLDIVLQVTCELDLQYSTRLLATCRTYQSLSASKDFWLKSLERMEAVHRRPLPCSAVTALLTLSLEKLQETAIHAYRLLRNLSSERPVPVSEYECAMNLKHGRNLKFLIIPGTRYIVACSVEGMSCWDTVSGACLASMPSEPGVLMVTICDTPLERPGECSFAVAFEFLRYTRLAVVRIDHQVDKNVTITLDDSVIWQREQSHYLRSVALDETRMGMVLLDDTADRRFELVYCDLPVNSALHRVVLPHTQTEEFPLLMVQDGQFYIAAEQPNSNPLRFEISRVDIERSHSTAPVHDIHTIPRVVPAPPDFRPDSNPMNRFCFGSRMYTPKYGVSLITHGSFCLDNDVLGRTRRQTSVYFWPATRPDSATDLKFAPLCLYTHHRDISRLYPGSSGTCALITYHNELGKGALGLLQYVQTGAAPHIVFRELHTSIPPSSSEIVLDDALGMVYMIHANRLSVVAYV